MTGVHPSYGPRREKTCLQGFANNTGANQPAHPRSLICAFVISVLESTIPNLATSKISLFYLVSVAEETGLNLTLSETPKTGFVATRPMCVSSVGINNNNLALHYTIGLYQLLLNFHKLII